jgi:signal transduction histidine kinase
MSPVDKRTISLPRPDDDGSADRRSTRHRARKPPEHAVSDVADHTMSTHHIAPRLPWRRLVLPGGATGLLTFLLVVLAVLSAAVSWPTLGLQVASNNFHVEVATAAAFVTLLVALLAAGRFHRTLERRDLMVSGAMGVIGLALVLFSLIPTATSTSTQAFAQWGGVLGRIVCGALLLGAAWMPARSVRQPGPERWRMLFGCLCVVGLTAVLAALLGPELPHLAAPALVVGASPPAFSGNATTDTVQAVSFVLFAAAAVGFARPWFHRTDRFTAMLIAGTSLLALSWLNYLLVTAIYSDQGYNGDVLRLFAYLVFALGAASEISVSQRELVDLAAAGERGRIARDLHDGLGQDLVYVLQLARRLHRLSPSEDTAELIDASEHALDETRITLSTFRAPVGESLRDALERVAGERGQRLGLDVRVKVPPGSVAVTPPVRETLLRALAECLNNAARHGNARHATVELFVGELLRLRVADDGEGFDPLYTAEKEGSYGLLGMRERAADVGGRLYVDSTPGGGTVIDLVVP